MSFTDEDLRWLKEAENALLRSFKVPALLARLEAAEDLINKSSGQEGWWDVEKELTLWRKAAGK